MQCSPVSVLAACHKLCSHFKSTLENTGKDNLVRTVL